MQGPADLAFRVRTSGFCLTTPARNSCIHSKSAAWPLAVPDPTPGIGETERPRTLIEDPAVHPGPVRRRRGELVAVSNAYRDTLATSLARDGQTCSRTLRSIAVATMSGIRGRWLARGGEATAVA